MTTCGASSTTHLPEPIAELTFPNGGGYIRDKKIKSKKYEKRLEKLQIELVKLQRWVREKGERVVLVFEGRDAAGKGGTIRRFMLNLNPRYAHVVALAKPSDVEQGQWYFPALHRPPADNGVTCASTTGPGTTGQGLSGCSASAPRTRCRTSSWKRLCSKACCSVRAFTCSSSGSPWSAPNSSSGFTSARPTR
jgi:hypothetical protein